MNRLLVGLLRLGRSLLSFDYLHDDLLLFDQEGANDPATTNNHNTLEKCSFFSEKSQFMKFNCF